MVRQILSSIEGVAIYAILAMIIFFVFFLVMVTHTLRLPKEQEDAFSRLPFAEEDQIQSIQENELKK
jgi:cbb3-type cytochrome oxidase subunit 3